MPQDLLELLLLFGSVVRLTRFVVSDDLGLWLIKKPARKWSGHDPEYIPLSKKEKLVSGLDCPFCVGFWISFIMTVIYFIVDPNSTSLTTVSGWWFVVSGALTLNWFAAHIGARLGDVSHD